MTGGKAALWTAGLVGVVALGVVTGPAIRDNWSKAMAPSTVSAPAVESADVAATKPDRPAARPAKTVRARASEPAPVKAARIDSSTVQTVAVDVWEPELRDRVKSVLNQGSKPEIAAANFANAEEFMT